MKIYSGQMIYNTGARYNISSEVLRTKIMPRGTTKEEQMINAEIEADQEPTNWGPLALAAAVAFVALG